MDRACVSPNRANREPAVGTGGNRVSNGRRLAEATQAWMEGHEPEFRFILAATERIGEREPHPSRLCHRIAMECERADVKVAEGEEPYRLNNTLWAGISRYMGLARPHLVGGTLRYRQSDIDCFGWMLPVSWLEVGDGR